MLIIVFPVPSSNITGGYYYYKTEKGMNYEDTIIAVKDYSDAEGIPYR